mgnify:CR=1 FL=1
MNVNYFRQLNLRSGWHQVLFHTRLIFVIGYSIVYIYICEMEHS